MGKDRALRRKDHREQHHHDAHDQGRPGDGPRRLLALLVGEGWCMGNWTGLAQPPQLLSDPLAGGSPLGQPLPAATHVSNERSETALVGLFHELPRIRFPHTRVSKCQRIVQIRDAPCRGPQVSSLRCVSSEGKQGVVVSEPIHPQVRIGHAHLKVADLRRATAFYRGAS